MAQMMGLAIATALLTMSGPARSADLASASTTPTAMALTMAAIIATATAGFYGTA